MHSISKLKMKFLFFRTIILLNLFQQIRTLDSESLESLQGSEDENNYSSQNPDESNHSLVPLPQVPPLEESSLENSVKFHHHHRSNAIVRASSHKNSNSNTNPNLNSNPRLQQHSNSNLEKSDTTCLTCATAQQNQQIIDAESSPSSLPERTLRAMRLEMIKQQILRKLRLEEPPKGAELPKDLPIPVALGDTLHRKNSQRSRDRDIEDFYGKTEQVIVFPEDAMPGCATFERRSDPSACFLFNLPRKIHVDEISNAELWVFKLPDPNDRLRNHTFYVSQVGGSRSKLNPESDEYDPVPVSARSKLIDVKSNIRQRHGWVSMNISGAAMKWMRSSNFEQTLQIGCKTCEKYENSEDLGSPVGTEGEQRPFIVFNMAGVVKKKRTRRHVNCSPGVTECCRERFVVNFREIGWDWIIGPASYDAYYCKGSCISVNSLSTSSTRRTSIIGRYLNTHGTGSNRTAELVPCCTATKMSSISLIYMDRGNNNTARMETLPNMVVESCGCL